MSNINIQDQELLISLDKKLQKLDFDDSNIVKKLKSNVTNKSLSQKDRITIEELRAAKKYLLDLKKKTPVSNFYTTNSPDQVLEKISELKYEVIDNLIRELEKQKKPSSSLIPIKGISKVMQAKLRGESVYDIPTLLTKGSTYEKRMSLAAKLEVNIKLVNSWVKQADLWRVEGMTTDMAYLLVLVGIRCVEDLAKVSVEKTYPILESLTASKTDFYLIEKSQLSTLINNAKELTLINRTFDINILNQIINEKLNNLTKTAAGTLASVNYGNHLTAEDIQKTLKDRTSSFSVLEFNEKAPVHLFGNEFIEDAIDEKESGNIIVKGLGFLDNVEIALPLPKLISGTVVKRKMNEGKDSEIAFPDVLVEIGGIVSPAEDKTEADKKPSSITDSSGKFIVVLPDRYSLKETITITVSQGSNKQSFIKSASEVLNSVPQQKELEKFLLLDSIVDEIDFLKNQKKEAERLKVWLEGKLNSGGSLSSQKQAEYKLRLDEVNELLKEDQLGNSIKEQIRELESQYNEKKDEIIKNYSSVDIKTAFNKFISSLTNLEAKLEGTNLNPNEYENFVVITEIFEGRDTTLKTALPSVKLMGNEKDLVDKYKNAIKSKGNPIHNYEDDSGIIRLSTDTAPSRVFNYSMLQRLVEPAIGSSSGESIRQTLTEPLDVEKFKSKLYEAPDELPKMSSLGIGYVLNMHQAWVPDGFALGSLLYSLVLAPGEEQRLVIRENKQRYSIMDEVQGMDTVSEDYVLLQEDDSTAAFNYAVNQLSQANSEYSYSAKTSSFGASFGAGAAGGGFSAMLGLSGGFSKSKGRGSSSARQSNSHNEASSAAQKFQHSIKSASDKISQAKRLSISTATSEVSDSVATKIIANHNHSHAMTIQYWEVMRRYRMETCIDSIDLVLFVPLKTIRFLPENQGYHFNNLNLENFKKTEFNARYGILLKYANSLQYALPYRYRTGLNLIRQYASYPKWEMEDADDSQKTLTLTFTANLIENIDNLSIYLVFKNGRGSVVGSLNYDNRTNINNGMYETTDELRQAIISERNNKGTYTHSCTFNIPTDIVNDDLAYIKFDYSCNELNFDLVQNLTNLTSAQQYAYNNLLGKQKNLAEDDIKSQGDRNKIIHYRSQLPEAFQNYPYKKSVKFSRSYMMTLGYPIIDNINIKFNNNNQVDFTLSNNYLNNFTRINFNSKIRTLRYAEFQKMEELLHHVAAETLHYSQMVWTALSEDERAMLLEQYTIDIDYNKLFSNLDLESETEDNEHPIPLLNCVNVKKLLGFYGNCMLLPFTYPQSLAKKLGKTAAEVQDSLYRYHSNNFRAPSTTISLPTDGMIGEAVLGETNVSEKIDLTRFWNWQDSPIDKMEIDSSYLNSNDYLAGKTTKDISALNLQGATAAVPVTNADLISALVSKQAPKFDNITGLDQLRDVLNAGTNSAAQGLQTAVTTSADMAKSAADLAKTQIAADKEVEVAKINKGINTESSNNTGNPTASDNSTTSTAEQTGTTGQNASTRQQPTVPVDNSTNNQGGSEATTHTQQPSTGDTPIPSSTNEQENEQNDEEFELDSVVEDDSTSEEYEEKNTEPDTEIAKLIENILADAKTMTSESLYKKYIDKEGKYDADKVKAKAKELCGRDYETITSLIGLMINEQKNN